MLQILNSDEVRDHIIRKYDLMNHYRINQNGNYPMTELNKRFEENISFNRTEYLSVRIDVMDENPKLAAEIANEIGSQLDTVKTRMQHDRAKQALSIVEKEYRDFQRYLDAREDTLTKLRSFGVLDYESQVERLSETYGKALMGNNTSVAKAVDEKMSILARYGGLYTSITEDMTHDREALSRLKTKYEEAKVDATERLPHKFVVNTAKPAEKKSYPVRWLIVLASTLATFLLAIVTMLVLENIQRVRQYSEN